MVKVRKKSPRVIAVAVISGGGGGVKRTCRRLSRVLHRRRCPLARHAAWVVCHFSSALFVIISNQASRSRHVDLVAAADGRLPAVASGAVPVARPSPRARGSDLSR